MKPEDKCYVPESGEFKDNFEYEYLERGGVWVEDSVLSVFDPTTMELINDSHNQGGLRVKFLDKSDVESLGWEHDYNLEPIPNRDDLPVFEGYALDSQKDTGELWTLFHFSDNVIWIEYTVNCGVQGYIFKGTIQNKSELITLLKQLGI